MRMLGYVQVETKVKNRLLIMSIEKNMRLFVKSIMIISLSQLGLMLNAQDVLNHSIWMLYPKPLEFHSSPSHYIKYVSENTIQFLSWQGDLVYQDTLTTNDLGFQIIGKSQTRIKRDTQNSNLIQLVYQANYLSGEGRSSLQYLSVDYVKLTPTVIDVDSLELARIMKNSKWKYINHPCNMDGPVEYILVISDPPIESSLIPQFRNKLIKLEYPSHIVNIEGTLIAIDRTENAIHSKDIIRFISKDKMSLQTTFDGGNEIELIRQE